jgi:PAS domain-containing protein
MIQSHLHLWLTKPDRSVYLSKSVDNAKDSRIAELQETIDILEKRLDRQKDLESRLNEILHDLHVHQEELRTQNDDLVAAQKEISQSQRKYRDLFDFAPIGYFLLDIHGVIRELNLTGADMVGRQRAHISTAQSAQDGTHRYAGRRDRP